MDKIFKQLYPDVKEEYLERAFEKLKKNGCPADEDLMVWFGKLVAAHIIENALKITEDDSKPSQVGDESSFCY